MIRDEELNELEFRPVRVQGRFLNDEELYVAPRWGKRLHEDELNVGLHVVTPFLRQSGYDCSSEMPR